MDDLHLMVRDLVERSAEPVTAQEAIARSGRPSKGRRRALATALVAFVALVAGAVLIAAGDDDERRPVLGDGVTTAPPVTDPPVPEVIAMHEDDARHLLESNGFRVEVIDEAHPVVAVGEVISQEPSGGSIPSPGSLVTIHVSLGPIPDVVGSPVRDAVAELRDGGFHLNIEIVIVPPGDADDGRVVSQRVDPTNSRSVVLEVGFDGAGPTGASSD